MAANNRRDFGSFHSSNVQELLSLDEEDYVPPTLPVDIPEFDDITTWEVDDEHGGGLPVYGRKAKRKFFYLEESCCFLNHGAFGAVLKDAVHVSQKWQEYSERQPLRFYDRELLPLLSHVTREMAKFVGCQPTDLALINNATYGTNSVLSSLNFGPGDVIVTFSNTYGAVKKLVQYVCEKTGCFNRQVNVSLPVTDYKQMLTSLEEELDKGDVSLVMVDHIPSNTPFIMPVKEIIQSCNDRHIKVFVDGAHSMGSLALNLSNLQPDFYVSNGHKWLCCPKGVAFLYVKPQLQPLIHPAVISHGLGSGFNSEFVWAGLHDYSPMLSALTVFKFWSCLGIERIQNYMHDMVCQGAKVLCQAWSSQLAAPEHMFASMALVELPSSLQSFSPEYSDAEDIQNKLYHQFNIEVPIKCLQGRLYVRISAHIHNEVSDYEKLAKAVLMIVQKKGNKLL